VGARPRRPARRTLGSPVTIWTCQIIGALLLLVAIAGVAYQVGLVLGGASLSEISGGYDERTTRIVAPLLPLMLAFILLTLAEFGRRGSLAGRETTFARGGTMVVIWDRRIGLAWHVLWVLVAFAAWAVIVAVPVILDMSNGDELFPAQGSREDFWTFVTIYGVTTSLIGGFATGSLAKRFLGDPRFRRAAPEAGRGAWTWLSHRWRIEIVLSVGAAVAANLAVMQLHTADLELLLLCAAIAAGCAVLSMVCMRQAWRSGTSPLIVESFA
jgi:hypothetical protein